MDISDENWNYKPNIDECEKSSYVRFEIGINFISDIALKALDNGFVHIIENQDNLNRSNDEELKLLIETNTDLKQEIASKLKESTLQQIQYENYKQDKELFKQEIKETHEAFLMARKHYKKYLNIYYSIESRSNGIQNVYIQFFTEVKKPGENYSVILLRNTKTKHYTLQRTTPNLRIIKELQKKLQETNDVPGLLCYIRQAFFAFKNNK